MPSGLCCAKYRISYIRFFFGDQLSVGVRFMIIYFVFQSKNNLKQIEPGQMVHEARVIRLWYMFYDGAGDAEMERNADSTMVVCVCVCVLAVKYI